MESKRINDVDCTRRRMALAGVGAWAWMACQPAWSQAGRSGQDGTKSILILGDSLSAEYGLARGSGWVALLTGWYTTEIGRQPFVVSGLIRTADVVTQTPSPTIAMSLAAYLLLYAFLLASYVAVLHRLARKSAQSQPDPVEGPHAMPSPAWSQAFR